MKKKNFKGMKIAGHTFTLTSVRFGLHTDETCDYQAALVCDGIPIGVVSNTGQGGATDFAAFREHYDFTLGVLDEVRKEVWITCKDGTVLYHDFGTVADDVLYEMYGGEELMGL